MANLQGQERAAYVQDMFDRIAGRYNLMNRLMTGGQDLRWRRFVVQQAQLPVGGRLLDLATGTGDIGFEALRTVPGCTRHWGRFFVGDDAAWDASSRWDQQMAWSGADALNLPFPDNSFDAVTSGYLLRNVIDISRTLAEQLRVLKPGGRIVVLDSSPPPPSLLKPFILLYLRYVIPLLGKIVVGEEGADAYQYLPQSTQAFKSPEELAAHDACR